MVRKRTDINDRDVALYFLCGGNEGYAKEIWRFGLQNIRGLILRRMRTQQDPLVEYYNDKSSRTRLHNGLHFFLAYHGEPVDHMELVAPSRDSMLYSHLQGGLYLPIQDDAYAKVSVERFFTPESNLERFVRHTANVTESDILHPAYVAGIRQAYGMSTRITQREVTSFIVQAVDSRISHGVLRLTSKARALLATILSSLPEN